MALKNLSYLETNGCGVCTAAPISHWLGSALEDRHDSQAPLGEAASFSQGQPYREEYRCEPLASAPIVAGGWAHHTSKKNPWGNWEENLQLVNTFEYPFCFENPSP